MALLKLTLKSILNRKLTSVLLILSIALSTFLLIGIQKIKLSAKESFSHSISGTDLIAGARSGQVQLLLYTLFRQGQPIANISWDSINEIQNFSEVKWVIPISLGDSHRGYPVLGTTSAYFKHYQYGKKRHIKFKKGHAFKETYDVVLGAKIAKKLNYKINTQIQLSHGMGNSHLSLHKDKVFKVVGILKQTGTPIDKTVHIPLEGITALHINWDKTKSDSIKNKNLTPTSVTSCLIGLKSKFSIFTVQRRISNWPKEALMAIIPGVTLSQLWRSISTVDTAFFFITILVTLITCISLLLSLLMSLTQRKKEIAILRSMGAHPIQIAYIIALESIIITTNGVLLGLLFIYTIGQTFKPYLEKKTGLILSLNTLSSTEILLGLGFIGLSIMISFIPALLAYRKSLSEGFNSI